MLNEFPERPGVINVMLEPPHSAVVSRILSALTPSNQEFRVDFQLLGINGQGEGGCFHGLFTVRMVAVQKSTHSIKG